MTVNSAHFVDIDILASICVLG